MGAFMLLLTTREFVRRRTEAGTFLVWSILWGGLILTGIFPEPYALVVAWLGMSTPIHFVTSFGIVVLLAITYQLYRRISEINFKLTRSIQDLALLNFNSKTEALEKTEPKKGGENPFHSGDKRRPI